MSIQPGQDPVSPSFRHVSESDSARRPYSRPVSLRESGSTRNPGPVSHRDTSLSLPVRWLIVKKSIDLPGSLRSSGLHIPSPKRLPEDPSVSTPGEGMFSRGTHTGDTILTVICGRSSQVLRDKGRKTPVYSLVLSLCFRVYVDFPQFTFRRKSPH